MNVYLLQPNLSPGNIASNAQELVALIANDSASRSPSSAILYVAGCETTIGQTCSSLNTSATVLAEQLSAFRKIQAHLGDAALLIGGVQLSCNTKPYRLHHQIFFLTRNELVALLPQEVIVIGNSHKVSIQDSLYKVLVCVHNLGDYFRLQLSFTSPLQKELNIYMNSEIKNFSPYSLEKLIPIFKAECRSDFYLSNRVDMVHGQMQGGYSGYYPYMKANAQPMLYPPYVKGLLQNQYMETFPKYTVAFQYETTVHALQFFFEKIGQKKAILGLSGGIDSALVLVIAAEALGAKNVIGIIMPSQFTADQSITSALELAKSLGIETKIISIRSLTDSYLDALAPSFNGLPADTTEENLQARVRAVLLMALSNKLGNILLNTSNKSECAVGYSTIYGDACGAISVIGALCKTEVYEMARWLNREKEIIPNFIIERPPSAELRPDQTDQDSLPPYDILDAILREIVDRGKHPEHIHLPNVSKETVHRVARLVQGAAYKRYQMPPCLRIAPDPFFDK